MLSDSIAHTRTHSHSNEHTHMNACTYTHNNNNAHKQTAILLKHSPVMFIDGYHGHNPLSFPPPLPLAGGMHFRSPPQRKMHSGLHVVASCTQSLTPDALELLLKVSEGVLHLAIGRKRAPRSERPVSPRHHHHRKESTDRGGHHVGCGQGKSKRSNDRRLPPIVKNGVVLPSKGVVPLCRVWCVHRCIG